MNSHAKGTSTHSSGKGIQVNKPELPKGGGSIQGMGETFAPNEFNGTSSLSIPIPATPCRGFEPEMSLNYSSGNGNSPFGLGWDLSLPEITRQTSKGIPLYDDSDTFLFTGDDYLVPLLDDTGQPVVKNIPIGENTYSVHHYLPRTQGAFDIIERYTNQQDSSDVFWKITSKENIVSIFGKSEAAKIFDPADQSRIYKWLLEESYDTKGNHEIYHYKKETDENIPANESEVNRDKQTNSYLTQVSYGNDRPILDGSLITGESGTIANSVLWHFDVIFDYGSYNIAPSNLDPYTPPDGNTWCCRLDPFSSYSAGFEIRTYRLCKNILLFHRFAELNTQPVLTSVLKLKYNKSPLLTLLINAEHTGYQYIKAVPQKKKSALYRTKSLPPLEFDYTEFALAPTTDKPDYIAHDYENFTNADGQDLTQVSSSPDYQLIDLYGEGVPGVLYADGQTIRYQAAQHVATDTVCYTAGKDIAFPISRQTAGANHSLTDVTGDGKLDLFVSTPSQAGYYEINSADNWQPFEPFESFPTDYHNSNNRHVDVTGDGLSDILLIEDDRVRIYPSKRQKGYGKAQLHTRDNNVPTSKDDTPTQLIRFTDMVGSGQSQLVRISNGLVECWPSLGYGKFGKKIEMDNAPDFGEDFDTARLRLTDIDGSGMTDLAYIYPERIEIYLNQSGNAFATKPICLALPASWDRLDQIQFADVRGNGTSCLVFTQTHPNPRQWFYDFNLTKCKNEHSKVKNISQKPHLLKQINNNMGARTEITYASSTKFYLEDKANNLPWITSLPFPVNVIESVTDYDDISQTSAVSSYRYHHGYYDGYEREFRGFGRVDRTDASSFADYTAHIAEQDAAYSPPPAFTKTWYHTGVYLEEDLVAQFKKEYWNKDAKAYAMPPTAFKYKDGNGSSNAVRNAHRTLHGTVIRSEVYGNDDSPWKYTPYTVSESQYKVTELQNTAENKYPVFILHEQESISYDYERNAKDPRISHNFILNVDKYGQVKKSTSINYGRRESNSTDIQTNNNQTKTWITYQEYCYINTPDITPEPCYYLLGVDKESKSYEIMGISLKKGDYFSFEIIKDQIISTLAKPTSVAFAKLLHWERDYYYNAVNKTELNLGEVTAQKLHHRTEFVEFDKEELKKVVSPSTCELYDLVNGDKNNNHDVKGGYITFSSETESKYFWNPGSSQSYDAENFFLPNNYFDPFQYEHIWYGAPPLPPTVPRTSYTYDPYCLLISEVKDPLQNLTLFSQFDYQHLAPLKMQDINDNESSVIFDPLGMVIATSFGGEQAGEKFSFADLSNYEVITKPSLEDVMDDSPDKEKDKYLQGAASFFYYELNKWKGNRVPPHSVQLVYEDYTYINDKKRTDMPNIQKSITYSDGFGRHLQSKALLNSKETVQSWDAVNKKVITKPSDTCWLTTGAVRYNNKGQPIKKYEPFFSADYYYVNEKKLNDFGFSNTLFYDALGRNAFNISQEGFIDKTLYGSWGSKKNTTQYHGYLNQKLYQKLPYEFVPSPWHSLTFDANDSLLDSCYTPTATADVNNDAFGKANKFANTPFEHIEDSMGHTIQSKQLYVQEIEENASFVSFDIMGNELTNSDQRQHAINNYNFQTTYNLSKEAIHVISADAGKSWSLSDIVGNPIYHKDSRNFESFYSYDVLHRPVESYVQGGDFKKPLKQLSNIVKKLIYGDSQNSNGQPYFDNPKSLNLRGQAVIHLDEAGLSVTPSFTIHDEAIIHAQWLKIDYKNEAEWLGVTEETLTFLIGTIYKKYKRVNYQDLCLPETLKALLDTKVFITTAKYDAIGRVTRSIDADNNTQTPAYYSTNWLKGMKVSSGTIAQTATMDANETPSLSNIRYNAKGQRVSIEYANGVKTTYCYDPNNFRLVGIQSKKSDDAVAALQDLTYHHDPEGNVTSVTNNAIPTTFFNGAKVDAKADYTYDALYHLIKATGREHGALPKQDPFIKNLTDPLSNGNALQNYTQWFHYDCGGNLTQIRHSGDIATRKITIQKCSNRITSRSIGSKPESTTTYNYDASGNMTTLDGAAGASWNYRNNMQYATIINRKNGNNDAEYYVYDGAGRRVRKVSEQYTAGSLTISEVIYLGGIEIRRTLKNQKKTTPFTGTTEEWHSVRIMDGDDCACIWRYWKTGNVKLGAKKNQLRYQLNDLLNSSNYEYDEHANIISYQEYYPYGGTSIIAAKSQTEVNNKHYQYSGKEKDMTGLYYYGMRYYCPWLARWTSADPAGTIDGLNLYAFVGGNPVTHVDVGGMGKSRNNKPRGSNTKVSRNNTNVRRSLRLQNKKNPRLLPIRTPLRGSHAVINARQSSYAGIGKRGRKTYPELCKTCSPKENVNYTTQQRSVTAILKINGMEVMHASNGPQHESLTFMGVSISNQNGKKINPHAEDVTLGSFRAIFNQSNNSDLKTFLTSNNIPGSMNNKGTNTKGKHVFSLRINYSPCHGCVQTIKEFKNFLDRELPEENLLRVKVLRPYKLPSSLKDDKSDTAQNFLTSIGELQHAGISTRWQPLKSAQKMNPSINDNESFKQETLDMINPLHSKYMNESWTSRGDNRK